MKIFIIGLPQSGRTTVARAIEKEFNARYIDAISWVKATFRDRREGEHIQRYEDEYDHFLSVRRMINPWFVTSHVAELLKSHETDKVFVIDGINSPRDFAELFDYRSDVVVFLNRTDGAVDYKDHENVGVSVIRDFCLWMSSAGLLAKNKWLEYNFKIPGEESDFIKTLGAKNSVYIVKSFNKVISHLSEHLKQIGA
jgi:adenylate kinase family enzyme